MIALILILFSSISFSQDFGDNSDGVCNFTGGAQAKSVWNCTDLFVSNTNTFPAASAVVLKVSGSVSIAGGGVLSVSAAGQVAGPGAMNGGVCSSTPCSSPQTDATNTFGVVAAGGSAGTDDGLAASGGGGSGGTYNPATAGQNGTAGSNGGSSSQGTGGVASLTGYGSESNFATTMNGGSGGGAGGSSDEIGTLSAGGSGGGGGGIIKIFSKGTIDIDGSILSNGGAGSNGVPNGAAVGGGGGGGSGGSIFIYSQSTVSITGGVQALGGSGGSGGAGGTGGVGRIRIDSFDGTISGVINVNPSPSVFTAAALPSLKAKFKSDISHNCSFKTEQVDFYPSFIIGLFLGLMTMVALVRLKRI